MPAIKDELPAYLHLKCRSSSITAQLLLFALPLFLKSPRHPKAAKCNERQGNGCNEKQPPIMSEMELIRLIGQACQVHSKESLNDTRQRLFDRR